MCHSVHSLRWSPKNIIIMLSNLFVFSFEEAFLGFNNHFVVVQKACFFWTVWHFSVGDDISNSLPIWIIKRFRAVTSFL